MPREPWTRPPWDPGADYSSFNELKTSYMWMTRGDNCPVCNYLSGRIFSMDFWQSYAMPGKIHTNCDCYLQRVKDGVPDSVMDVFGMSAYSAFGYQSLVHIAHNFELLFEGKVFSNTGITDVDKLMQAYQKTGNWKDAYDLVYTHPFWDTSLWGLTFLSQRIFQTVRRLSGDKVFVGSKVEPSSLSGMDWGTQTYKRWWISGLIDVAETNYLKRLIAGFYQYGQKILPLMFAGMGKTILGTGRVLDPKPVIPKPLAPITTHHFRHIDLGEVENVLDYGI